MFVDNVGTSATHALPDDAVGFETPRLPLDLGFKCQEVGVGRPKGKTTAVLFRVPAPLGVPGASTQA